MPEDGYWGRCHLQSRPKQWDYTLPINSIIYIYIIIISQRYYILYESLRFPMRRPKVEDGVLVYPLRDKWSRWASSTCIYVYIYLYKPNSGRISTPVETGKRRKPTCNWTHSTAPLFYISILTQGEVQPLSWRRIASRTRRASLILVARAPIPVHIVAS